MYQQTLGRFLSRDPLAENGFDIMTDSGFYGNRLAAMRESPEYYGGNGVNLYAYVNNNPVNLVYQENKKDDTKCDETKCNVEICFSLVAGGLGTHLYLLITDCKGRRWQLRGGPSRKEGVKSHCKELCKDPGSHGQLVTIFEPWNNKAIDWPKKGEKHDCRQITIKLQQGKTCDDMIKCMIPVLTNIDNCCIRYAPVPEVGKGYNSNSVIGWLAETCLPPRPNLRPKTSPGYDEPVPECVRKGPPK